MGHRKQSAPKRGSMAYSPRKRSTNLHGHIRSWPTYEDEPRILGFSGFKAGMTHIIMREDTPNSPYLGQERVKPVTIIEAPPMGIVGMRGYRLTPTGKEIAFELWSPTVPKTLEKYFPAKEDSGFEGKKKAAEEVLPEVKDLRVIFATQPALASVSQKKPIINEYGMGGGTIEEQYQYLLERMGQEISLTDIFSEGEYIDTISITKGKGFQGPVKRWGIKILQHKSRKARRAVGSIGPWNPAHMMFTVPRSGQMGYHQRTEYNLRIVTLGETGRDITPAGGFTHYGVVNSSYLMVIGSVPGPINRFIRFRRALRPSSEATTTKPELVYIASVSSS